MTRLCSLCQRRAASWSDGVCSPCAAKHPLRTGHTPDARAATELVGPSRWRPVLVGVLAGALVVLAAWLLGGCRRCAASPASRCEPDSAQLARLNYQGVQAEASKRGRCVVVCYGRHERRICPDLDSGAPP